MATMMTMAMAVEKSNNQPREEGEEEDCMCREKRRWLWRDRDG
jgi:hypothetical protein